VVDIVYHHNPTWRQHRPYRVELEARVARRVQAVMNEEADLLEPADQLWQPPPARSLYIRPAGPEVPGDSYADLVMQRRIHGREIDAPQMTVPVTMKALKNYPAGEPVCNPRFHYDRGTQVRDEAPDGLSLRLIAVVPSAVGGQANTQARSCKARHGDVPDLAESLHFRARPWRVNCVV
jgi:hypothetical protein